MELLTEFSSLAPNIKILDKKLFAMPSLFIPYIFIQAQISKFQQTFKRLFNINPHMALLIIRFCTKIYVLSLVKVQIFGVFLIFCSI